MLRKLPADDSIAETAAEKPKVRAIKATIDSRRPRLVVSETIPCSASLPDDYAKIQPWFVDSDPCAVLVRLQDTGTLPAGEDDWLVVVWIPSSVPGPQKVLWGTSTDSIIEAMPSQCRIKGLDAASTSDVSWEKFFVAAEGVTGKQRPIFFDMKHSNNAARIRLWVALKEGMNEKIESRMLTYPDLKELEFTRVNPLGKVPAFRRTDGACVFESNVILDYLEDKFGDQQPSFKPDTPEDRQLMNLMIRIHDLYIASPNCTAPGFSHSQGAMYLSTEWHGKARGMDIATRAAKVAEIWKQLGWLNRSIVGPYLVGEKITLADFTWFPTTIFMEFMLPRVFGWPDVFRKSDGPFPKIAKWWQKISEEPAFKAVRQQIWEFWEEMEAKGQFKPIITEVEASSNLKFKYP